MKTCPVCQDAYPDDDEFSSDDGTRLASEVRDERECPYCAELILKKARVCKHCGRDVEPLAGTGIAAQALPPAPPGRIGETRSLQPQASMPVAAASRPPADDARFARSEAEKFWRARSDADLLVAARGLRDAACFLCIHVYWLLSKLWRF